MKYLKAEELIEINIKVGERGTLLNKGTLESVLIKVETSGNLALAAATLLYGSAAWHPFVNGNKRTALLSTLVFLEMNGKTVKASDKDLGYCQ